MIKLNWLFSFWAEAHHYTLIILLVPSYRLWLFWFIDEFILGFNNLRNILNLLLNRCLFYEITKILVKYGWCRRVIILCLLTWVHEVRRWLVGLRSKASVIPLNGCSVTNLISKLSRLAEGNGLIKRTNFGLRQRIYLLILLAVANLIKSNETIVRLEVKLCLLSVITHVERLKLLDIIYLLLLQSTECLNIFLIHWLYGHCFIMSFALLFSTLRSISFQFLGFALCFRVFFLGRWRLLLGLPLRCLCCLLSATPLAQLTFNQSSISSKLLSTLISKMHC